MLAEEYQDALDSIKYIDMPCPYGEYENEVIEVSKYKEKELKKLQEFIIDYEWTEDKNKELAEENWMLKGWLYILAMICIVGWIL